MTKNLIWCLSNSAISPIILPNVFFFTVLRGLAHAVKLLHIHHEITAKLFDSCTCHIEHPNGFNFG